MHPYFDTPTPHLFGHRGASAEAPENTRPAFERAWAAGVLYLETDCHATRDGEIVLLHDAALERTTDGSGSVRQASFTDVERLDAGYRFTPDVGRTFPYRGKGVRIPRLVDLLEWFPSARINLEIKAAEPEVAEEVIRIVKRGHAEHRMLLASDKGEVLEHVRKLGPGTAIGSSLGDVIQFFQALSEGKIDRHAPRGQALQIPPSFQDVDLATRECVEAAHRLGLFVHVWTINDADEMRKLLGRGMDGLMSDDPAQLLRVSRAHGARS